MKFNESNFTFNKNQFILCLKRYVDLWLLEKYAKILVRGKSSCQGQIFLSGVNLLVRGKSSCQGQIFLSKCKSSCQNGENYFLILLMLKTFDLNDTHVILSFVIFHLNRFIYQNLPPQSSPLFDFFWGRG